MTHRLGTWTPVAALPMLWIGHISLSYAAAGLRCHNVILGGDVLSVDAFRLAMLSVTLLAATALAVVALALLRRYRADDDDMRMAGFVGGVLASLFAVYLIWSITPALAGTAVC